MHWIDVIVNELLRKGNSHVVASGTSISGEIHIGNAGDVIIADAICRGLQAQGAQARLLWFMDDLDPFRKIPKQLPPAFDDFLGMPDFMLPCPEGCCKSFITHYTTPFIEDLHRIGVHPEIISSMEIYRSGRYDDVIRTALTNASKIRTVLQEISGAERAEDWLPFSVICEKCGKIATTQAYKFEHDFIWYRCRGGIAGKTTIPGCGHEDRTSIRNGKLHWRVDWAARWKVFGVTCEPFGKEHAAAGGSYDTSKLITKEIFSYEPPYPVIYEHILVEGRKMSKSLGNIITMSEFLRCAPAEVVRYFFFRTKAAKHKDFTLQHNLLQLVEDYERTERIYFGRETFALEKELPDVRRAYELSQPSNRTSEIFFQVPYRHLLSVAQITSSWDCQQAILERGGYLRNEAIPQIKSKLEQAKYWLLHYGPAELKFELQKEYPKISLNEKLREFLHRLAKRLEESAWEPEEIHRKIYDTSQELEIEPKKCFETLYLIFLAQTWGPRAGYFLSMLEREFVISRLKNVPERSEER